MPSTGRFSQVFVSAASALKAATGLARIDYQIAFGGNTGLATQYAPTLNALEGALTDNQIDALRGDRIVVWLPRQ